MGQTKKRNDTIRKMKSGGFECETIPCYLDGAEYQSQKKIGVYFQKKKSADVLKIELDMEDSADLALSLLDELIEKDSRFYYVHCLLR